MKTHHLFPGLQHHTHTVLANTTSSLLIVLSKSLGKIFTCISNCQYRPIEYKYSRGLFLFELYIFTIYIDILQHALVILVFHNAIDFSDRERMGKLRVWHGCRAARRHGCRVIKHSAVK